MIRLMGLDAGRTEAQDNPAASRFELTVDGLTAFLVYERHPDTLVLVHTEVPDGLRGHHLGNGDLEPLSWPAAGIPPNSTARRLQ